ncbi:MAG: arginase [Acidobacteria bacterium]|nr:MAG: arginase [Acidobacteriota bacterium]REK00228.1 MAG: arginase [Acidobacteriota bacterium]
MPDRTDPTAPRDGEGRAPRRVRLIGIPMDYGQARRGVDMGPAALRHAGLAERLRRIGVEVVDGGNVEPPIRDTLPDRGGLAYMDHVVAVCERVYREARAAIEAEEMPLFLGGDHSLSLGTVAGIAHGRRVGVLWVDAHGDFNTPETSASGNIHGMPLAALVGLGDPRMTDLGTPGPKVRPEDVVLIGVRDLDEPERVQMRRVGVQVFTMRDLDELGVAVVTRRALDHLSRVEHLHVSLDMDALDPSEAPGVGTPVDGGLTFREAHLLMELLAQDGRVHSADLVEVNPILDNRNETARLAVGLVASLMGKVIY